MSRFILLIVIVGVIYLLLKAYFKQSSKPEIPKTAEDMVSCAQCGINQPRSESIIDNGQYYCSEAHRQEHSRNGK